MADITKFTQTQYDIIAEISKGIQRITGGDAGFESAVNSWGDTLPDEDILQILKDLNNPKPIVTYAVDSSKNYWI